MNDLHADDEDLPPTMHELEMRRQDAETRRNYRRELLRIRRDNAKRGHAEPVQGTTLYVQLDGSVSRRRRAGIGFERGQQVAVEVVSATDEEVKAIQATGKNVVNVYGAEQILEDNALHVYAQPMADIGIEALKQSHASLEEELRVTRAERDDLQAKIRDARMTAKDPGDGRPGRLAAAAKVAQTSAPASAAAPTTASAEHSEFGAPAPDKK